LRAHLYWDLRRRRLKQKVSRLAVPLPGRQQTTPFEGNSVPPQRRAAPPTLPRGQRRTEHIDERRHGEVVEEAAGPEGCEDVGASVAGIGEGVGAPERRDDARSRLEEDEAPRAAVALWGVLEAQGGEDC
jgi:hypothetical protein